MNTLDEFGSILDANHFDFIAITEAHELLATNGYLDPI